ncbi:MAG TPA: AzlD domain-containing protein [Actinomycetes bacterium]|nr:AzlD domain-containing protein [Actinomycetes bacterium]
MSAAWLVVVCVGAATVAIKAAGPALLGGRPLPPRLERITALLAPALLAAFVGVAVLSSGRRLVADARLAGVAAALVALRLRAPVLVVIAVAAATTAVVRALA